MDELIILADELTDAVNDGYLPAARRLGLRVTLLTDQVAVHRRYFAQERRADCPDEIVECDVGDALDVIGVLTGRRGTLAGLFTDSPRLQTCAAVAAEYLHLPGKDWHVTYRASDASEMRCRLRELGFDHGGNGSEEESVDAPIHTLVTLGDGRELRPLGAGQAAHVAHVDSVLRVIREFGIGLGISHTRYVLTTDGPRILDISYCNLAARGAFALQEQLRMPLFETVLRLHMGEPLPALAQPAQRAYGLTLSTFRRWASSKTQAFS